MQPASRDLLLAEAANTFFVTVVTTLKKKQKNDVRQELEALPARLRQHGLLSTLVYYQSASDSGGHDRGDRTAIGEELLRQLTGNPVSQVDASDILTVCQKDVLRQRTEEAQAYAAWLKLMAKALIPKVPAKGGEQEKQDNAT